MTLLLPIGFTDRTGLTVTGDTIRARYAHGPHNPEDIGRMWIGRLPVDQACEPVDGRWANRDIYEGPYRALTPGGMQSFARSNVGPTVQVAGRTLSSFSLHVELDMTPLDALLAAANNLWFDHLDRTNPTYGLDLGFATGPTLAGHVDVHPQETDVMFATVHITGHLHPDNPDDLPLPCPLRFEDRPLRHGFRLLLNRIATLEPAR